MFPCKVAQDEVTKTRLRVGSKYPALAAHPPRRETRRSRGKAAAIFYTRSVCVIREHGKMSRTPLAAFIRPIMVKIPKKMAFRSFRWECICSYYSYYLQQVEIFGEVFPAYAKLIHPLLIKISRGLKELTHQGVNR
jgi:hypothetical protein